MFKGKRLLIAGLLVVCSAFVASNALAETVSSSAGELVIGTNAGSADKTIGLSKGVQAIYINPGTTAPTAQWYAAGTVHSGGNVGYATAQNLTNIMSQSYAPGSDTAAFLATVPTTETSETEWANWTAQ